MHGIGERRKRYGRTGVGNVGRRCCGRVPDRYGWLARSERGVGCGRSEAGTVSIYLPNIELTFRYLLPSLQGPTGSLRLQQRPPPWFDEPCAAWQEEYGFRSWREALLSSVAEEAMATADPRGDPLRLATRIRGRRPGARTTRRASPAPLAPRTHAPGQTMNARPPHETASDDANGKLRVPGFASPDSMTVHARSGVRVQFRLSLLGKREQEPHALRLHSKDELCPLARRSLTSVHRS